MSAIGELENASLSERLRELRAQRWSGAVRVREIKGSGAVFLVEGRVVHAEYGRLAGESAYWQLLGLPNVQIDVIEGAVPERYSILRPVPTAVPSQWELATMEPPPPPIARSERSPLLARDDPRFESPPPPPPVESLPPRGARAEPRLEPASEPGVAREQRWVSERLARSEPEPEPPARREPRPTRPAPEPVRIAAARGQPGPWEEPDEDDELALHPPAPRRSVTLRPEPEPALRASPEPRSGRPVAGPVAKSRLTPKKVEVEKPAALLVDDLAVSELTARLAAAEDRALRLESLLRHLESKAGSGRMESFGAHDGTRVTRFVAIVALGLAIGAPLGVWWKESASGSGTDPAALEQQDRPVSTPPAAPAAVREPAPPVAARPSTPAGTDKPAATDEPAAAVTLPASRPAAAAVPVAPAAQPAALASLESRAIEVGDLVGPATERPVLERMPVLPSPDPKVALAPEIVVRLLVDEQGDVARAAIFGSRPGLERFERAALEEGQKLRFKPARREGKPVPVWIHVPVRFR